MNKIETIEHLETLYGTPGEASLRKVSAHLTPTYKRWIDASRFCVLTTVGPESADGSPRGDDGPVTLSPDPKTLLMPDWHGNQRMDSLRNIVRDGRVSLMFMVSGAVNVIRVNGTAILSDDPQVTTQFEQKGRHPKTVIVITIAEVYSQCARALIRADLWARDDKTGLPSMGDILEDVTNGDMDGAAYDAAWPARAAKTMW